MPLIAKVAVSAATYSIDKPYDYLVPIDCRVFVGVRVLVPFGRGNKISEALVLSVEERETDLKLKSICNLLDEEPIIDMPAIKLVLWMKQRYFCTFYDALHTVLPSAVWFRHEIEYSLTGDVTAELDKKETALVKDLEAGKKSELELLGLGHKTSTIKALVEQGILHREIISERRIHDKVIQLVSLSMPYSEALVFVGDGKRKSKQRDTIEFLQNNGETPVSDLSYYTGIARGTLNRLEKNGVVRFREREEYRISTQVQQSPKEIVLNEEQEKAFREILTQVDSNQPGVTLLEGVTGSGKTLIYIRLAQELVRKNKTVMILVPEIALTPQMMARFVSYFGNDVALLHSALQLSERYDQYKRIKRGEVHIVLGTRSAVFAPLSHMGLIIMDEEQESSYESEKSPCYHARDIAKYRCAQEGARLVLGSATPTIESAYYADQGTYQKSVLRKRYNAKNLPEVILADMKKELRTGNSGNISTELRQELEKNLRNGEQSILFINRRGNSRQLLCPSCGYVPMCPRCSANLTYHSANNRLMCHYCGYSEKTVERCPDCGDLLKKIGTGTQKVEEELQELFPSTKILRMDADTIGLGHEKILKEFEEKKVPILLGTQMVAKGLDFENVTLVGVLAADLGLFVDHYRAAERTFSLLTQVVGRAGRGEKAGRAVIQTFTPENDVIKAAASQDYEGFYRSEIEYRKARKEPPFADQMVVTVVGEDETKVIRSAGDVRQKLDHVFRNQNFGMLTLLGPAPCAVVKVNNRYRYRITVIGKNTKPMRDVLSAIMIDFGKNKDYKGINIYTDCNLMD